MHLFASSKTSLGLSYINLSINVNHCHQIHVTRFGSIISTPSPKVNTKRIGNKYSHWRSNHWTFYHPDKCRLYPGSTASAPSTKSAISSASLNKTKAAWMKIPPSVREPRTNVIGSKHFNSCIHHMAWTLHHPDHCRICPRASKAVPPPSTANLATDTAMSTKAIICLIETTLSCIVSAEATSSRFWQFRHAWLVFILYPAMADVPPWPNFPTLLHYHIIWYLLRLSA